MGYQWSTILGYLPQFFSGAWHTVQITAMAYALALVLGLLAAVGRDSTIAPLRWICGAYVEVIRNTPVLLQIFIVFFGLPSLGLRLSAFSAGIVALGVNVGAYVSEVFRAGISSVPRGQREACQILALDRSSIFWKVVMPQAVRAVFPTLVNFAIITLLGTSLLSAVALPELTGEALVINARTLLFVQVFVILLAFYLTFSALISLGGALIGKYAFHPPLPPRQRRGRLLATLRRHSRRKAVAA